MTLFRHNTQPKFAAITFFPHMPLFRHQRVCKVHANIRISSNERMLSNSFTNCPPGTFQTSREKKKWITVTDKHTGIPLKVTTRTRLASSVENLGFLSDSRTWATPVTSTHSFRFGFTTRSSGRRSTHGTRSRTKRRRTTRSAQ